MTNVTVSERAARIAAMLADVPVKGLAVGEKPYIVLHALNRDAIVDLLASIPTLEAEIREECAAEKAASVAEEWSAYMDEAVSSSDEPLKELGRYLADILDEDRWKTAERYLNAAAIRQKGQP